MKNKLIMEKEYVSGNAIYAVDVNDPNKKIKAKISSRSNIGIEDYDGAIIKKAIIEPIEITTYILIDNGFKHTYDFPERYYFPTGTATYFVKFDIEEGNFYIGMENSGHDHRVSIPLTYLHELQNAAYYIRGKELNFTKY